MMSNNCLKKKKEKSIISLVRSLELTGASRSTIIRDRGLVVKIDWISGPNLSNKRINLSRKQDGKEK